MQLHKYHNVIQGAGSFQTLAIAQMLLPQIKQSLDCVQEENQK